MIQLLDHFIGANGTALADHAPVIGGPWVDSGPGLEIQDNKLTGSDASGASHCPLLKKTAKVFFGADNNGMDNGSFFQVGVKHDGGGESEIRVTGEGDFTFFCRGDGGSKTRNGIYYGQISAGLHQYGIAVGPQRTIYTVDQRVLFVVERSQLLSTTLLLAYIQIDVAAGTYPLISNLLVTD